MKNYKLLMVLVAFSACQPIKLLSQQQSDPIMREIRMWKMKSSRDEWWREKIRKIWDKDLIAVENRKRFTPKTFRFGSFNSRNYSTSGFFHPATNGLYFPDEPLSVTRMKNVLSGSYSYLMAHEYVHFCKDNVEDEEKSTLIDSLDNKSMILMNHKIDNVLAKNSPEDDFRIMHQEAYADLKGLELLENKMPDDFHRFMHTLNNFFVKNENRCGAEKYLGYGELLFCWGLYQKHQKELSNVDSDTILHDTIDDYLKHRSQYKTAIQSHHFLKKFNQDRSATLIGAADNHFDLPQQGVNAGGYLALSSIVGASLLTAAFMTVGVTPLPVDGMPFFAALAVGTAGFTQKNRIQERIVCVLGSAYNSSYVWDRDKFADALDTDTARVAELAQRLIKRDKLDQIKRKKEHTLLASQQETDSVHSYFENINLFA